MTALEGGAIGGIAHLVGEGVARILPPVVRAVSAAGGRVLDAGSQVLGAAGRAADAVGRDLHETLTQGLDQLTNPNGPPVPAAPEGYAPAPERTAAPASSSADPANTLQATGGAGRGTPGSFGPQRPITGSKPIHPPDSAFTPEALAIPDGEIAAEIAEMKAQGHAVDRHGADVTDGQTKLRAGEGIDPMTMTREDGVRSGDAHRVGPTATQFTSDRAQVAARRAVEASPDYQTELAKAVAANKERFEVSSTSLESALGPDYLQHVNGSTRTGPRGPNASLSPTDLTNGHLKAYYIRDNETGKYDLNTLFPDV